MKVKFERDGIHVAAVVELPLIGTTTIEKVIPYHTFEKLSLTVNSIRPIVKDDKLVALELDVEQYPLPKPPTTLRKGEYEIQEMLDSYKLRAVDGTTWVSIKKATVERVFQTILGRTTIKELVRKCKLSKSSVHRALVILLWQNKITREGKYVYPKKEKKQELEFVGTTTGFRSSKSYTVRRTASKYVIQNEKGQVYALGIKTYKEFERYLQSALLPRKYTSFIQQATRGLNLSKTTIHLCLIVAKVKGKVKSSRKDSDTILRLN